MKDKEKKDALHGRGAAAPGAGGPGEEAAAREGSAPHAETAEFDLQTEQEKEREALDEETRIIAELQERVRAQQEKHLRLMAEFDNYKRRTSQEYQRLIESANEKLMLELVEVRDNFERGLNAGEPGFASDKFFEGMKLIYGRFDEILLRNGLASFGGRGEPFDPLLHDAMMKRADDEIAEGRIAEVYEKGYKLRGRVIRHAKVIISEGGQGQAAQDPDDSAGQACD